MTMIFAFKLCVWALYVGLGVAGSFILHRDNLGPCLVVDFVSAVILGAAIFVQ